MTDDITVLKDRIAELEESLASDKQATNDLWHALEKIAQAINDLDAGDGDWADCIGKIEDSIFRFFTEPDV